MDTDIIGDILSQIEQIEFLTPSLGVIVAIVLAVLLLVVSGFASGSEIAIFSLTPKEKAELDIEHSQADHYIEILREDSERTLATILIINNLVNVTIIMLCNYIFAQTVDFHGALLLQFICITILLTFLLLLFGEIIPKIYSRQKPLAFCRRVAMPLMVMRKMCWPLEVILLKSGILAEKIVKNESHVLSVDELEQALEMTDKDEIKGEESILQGIIRFGDETVCEVMTHRQDVINLNITTPYKDVLHCVVENNYSRIPIYQDNEDNIRGVLYIKDLLPHLSKPATFHWQSLIRPPFFVPETKKIDDLLRDFQKNKVHIAIVVDEFGGTSGIVTMEDILEEIVGEINDEFDEEERNYTRLNYNTYIFEGRTEIDEMIRILNTDEEVFNDVRGEADSIAGLLLELKGDFPALHERLNYKNYTFEVIELEGRRISRVKLIVHASDAKEEDR